VHQTRCKACMGYTLSWGLFYGAQACVPHYSHHCSADQASKRLPPLLCNSLQWKPAAKALAARQASCQLHTAMQQKQCCILMSRVFPADANGGWGNYYGDQYPYCGESNYGGATLVSILLQYIHCNTCCSKACIVSIPTRMRYQMYHDEKRGSSEDSYLSR
jgi:hypothetical protein